MKTNIYLDIDGVLLLHARTPALHVYDFLSHVLDNHPDSTFWLTTHCQGDASVPIDHVGRFFDARTVQLMKQIKATRWDTGKTEGIDFSMPFLWFDDSCFEFEKDILRKNGVFENWIQVDLKKTEHQLGKFVSDFPLPVEPIRNTVISN